MRGLRLGLGLSRTGGIADPSAGYALYLDFKNQLYRSGSTLISSAVALGPEICGDPGFNGGGWWILDAGVTISGGKGVWTATTGNAYHNAVLNIGSSYTATYTVDSVTGGTIGIVPGGVQRAAPGTYTETFVATQTYFAMGAGGTTATAQIDNVSVKAVGIAALPGYSYTRTGAKQELLASGAVSSSFAANVPGITTAGYYSRGAVTNLLLNAGQSTSLSTQNVTVTAQAYTLYFMDTGTVTLSGVSVAGPLVGTGVNNQVSLTFTPTAGTLTLTVTGNVAYSNLVAGSAVGPIIATAGATVAVGADALAVSPPALADQDMLIWVDWTPKETVASGFVSQYDNGTNDADSFIFFANGGTRVWVASGLQHNDAGAAEVVGVRHTRILRRLSGNWRSGKIVAGVLTWAAAGGAGTFPTAVTTLRPGKDTLTVSNVGQAHAGDFIKVGTFTTDAAVLAAVAGTGI